VRRATPLAALALSAALALVLSACSGTATETPSTSSSATAAVDSQDLAVLQGVKVSGALGKEPTVTLPATPFNVTSFVARLVEDGTGASISSGQIVSVHEVGVNGEDGSTLGSTWSSGAQSLTAGSNTTLGNLDEILLAAHVGARILVAYPTSTDTSTTSASSQVIVLDVMDAYSVPKRASGTAVTPAAGLPAVTLSSSGEPSITPVSTPAPTALVVQPLIKGTGAVVATGQTVTVQYSGWLWDGTSFDSSWKNGSPATFSLSTGSLIDGWVEGIAGQTVGSQVLLIVPPDKGYGATAQGSIPANSTLVFVVDILDAR
jgi:peptidylprolyl isomerase